MEVAAQRGIDASHFNDNSLLAGVFRGSDGEHGVLVAVAGRHTLALTQVRRRG